LTKNSQSQATMKENQCESKIETTCSVSVGKGKVTSCSDCHESSPSEFKIAAFYEHNTFGGGVLDPIAEGVDYTGYYTFKFTNLSNEHFNNGKGANDRISSHKTWNHNFYGFDINGNWRA